MSKKKSKKPKRGRPPLADGQVRSEWLKLRVSKPELKQIEANADASGKQVGPWARERLLKPDLQ